MECHSGSWKREGTQDLLGEEGAGGRGLPARWLLPSETVLEIVTVLFSSPRVCGPLLQQHREQTCWVKF